MCFVWGEQEYSKLPRASLKRSSVTRDVVWDNAVTLLARRVLQTSNLKLPSAPFGIVTKKKRCPGANPMHGQMVMVGPNEQLCVNDNCNCSSNQSVQTVHSTMLATQQK